MTNEEIFAVLRPHVMAVSNVPECILYGQNENAPSGAYASIQPGYMVDERGQANIINKDVIDDQVESDVRPQVAMTCIVEFYRGNAHENARSLLQFGRLQNVVWDLFKYGVSIRSTSNVMDLTALQSSNYEKRARIELYLWMTLSTKYTVNNILGTSVIAENESGDTLQEINIDIRG